MPHIFTGHIWGDNNLRNTHFIVKGIMYKISKPLPVKLAIAWISLTQKPLKLLSTCPAGEIKKDEMPPPVDKKENGSISFSCLQGYILATFSEITMTCDSSTGRFDLTEIPLTLVSSPPEKSTS